MDHIQEAERSKWMAHSNHNIKCFTKGDMDRMTNSYRTSLGSGGFGEVYEGVLEDGSKVAVKVFIHNVKENFAKELIVHREINHRSVVRLIGCCEEENALMLVTEYIANGNLSDFLHHNNCPIPLDMRLRIAIECAEALTYMHSHMYTQVIHGDIKPSNILLDRNFHAKLSDFGISRLANTDKTLHTENVIGSIGYMDPLFPFDGRLTVKYDVYSFGVVLLELIARKKATTIVDNVNIVNAFTNALASGVKGARGLLDAEIASKNNMKVLESVAKLAGECVMVERSKRPDMIDVVERLRVLRKALHQDQGHQRVDLFSWVRKSRPAPSAALTIPTNISPSDLCRQFSLEEMKAATNNFHESRVIGQGACGNVYLGKIDGGATEVAIKYSPINYFHSLIEVMSKLRHGNLVTLIGYCHQKEKKLLVYEYVKEFLVYEYMARGNLREYLYVYGTQGRQRQRQPPISWKRRMEICIGAARGLRYLHELQVIHGNVKAANILLDEEWLAKIADLTSPKPVSSGEFVTIVGGTVDYLDPEFWLTCQLTKKSDVYSFGCVLLEVLCGRPAYSVDFPDDKQRSLVSWALRCKEEGNLDQIVNPYLKGKINPQCFDKFVTTAEKCLALKGTDRPSIGDVILDLEYALQLQEDAEAASEGSAGAGSNSMFGDAIDPDEGAAGLISLP